MNRSTERPLFFLFFAPPKRLLLPYNIKNKIMLGTSVVDLRTDLNHYLLPAAHYYHGVLPEQGGECRGSKRAASDDR